MHMTNGASFNLTNKKYANNFENQSNSENPTYGNASASANQYNGTDSQGGSSGMNVKNTKNVLSGPLH